MSTTFLVRGAFGALSLAMLSLTGPAAFGGDLPTDPRVVTGTLENGLTYYIMPHDNPPKRASVWMHVSSGSLNETERQRGIAHYLEHMAFNGSKNFPPGTVVKYFETLGLTFGRHQNAFTSFEQTCYQLALPDNSVEKLRQAFLFMADVNGRLLLEPKEIESERQIILEEKTARKSGRQRVMEYMFTRMAPGSIYGDRLPIGTEETIKGVQREDFAAYYDAFYAPGNSAVIVVGDVDAKAVAQEIIGSFGDLPAKPHAKDQDAGVRPYEKSFAVVASDPELTRATVGMMKVSLPRPPVTTQAQLREEFVQAMAMSAFNRSIQEKVSDGAVSFLGGIAFASPMSNAMWSAQAQASGEPARWREMLADLATCVQRTRLHGFDAAAIEEARRDLLASAEQQAQQEPTLPARAHLTRINNALAAGEPIRSAAQRLESARSLLPSVSPEECSAWFATEFEPAKVMFFAQLPATGDLPGEADLLAAGEKAFAVTPEKEVLAKRAETMMEKLPAPGAVSEQAEHAASAVWSAWLSNGVRVHHKFNDQRKNEATVSITLIGAPLLETAQNRGVTSAAMVAWGQPATGSLTSNDIRSLMTGKKVNVGGNAGPAGVSLMVSGTPDELETGMQLAHLLLTDPKIEEAAFGRWKTAQVQSLLGMEKNPSQLFSKLMAKAVYPAGEVRTQPLTKAQVDALTLEASQAWLTNLVATSPIEVAVVGDVSREKAIELVVRYVGSLPTRARVSKEYLAEKRALVREKGPKVVAETIATKTDMANVMVGFYGPDLTNVADARAMQLAARVISSRMVQEIREKAQLVYSIAAASTPGQVYPGFGLFRSSAPTQPGKADALVAKITEMFDAFAAEGPTEDELKVAKGQIANTLDEAMKEPSFWMGEIASMTFNDNDLDRVLATPAAFEAISASDVKAAFVKYHVKENALQVVLRPAPAAEGSPASK
jgi:zinc protease